MAAIAGYGGYVKQGANTVANIKEWSLEIDVDMLDSSAFSNQWKSFIAGLKSWSGKFSGMLDTADTNGQVALQNAVLGGTSLTISLSANGTNSYSGTAFIKAEAPKVAVSGLAEVEFSFQGTGTLTYA